MDSLEQLRSRHVGTRFNLVPGFPHYAVGDDGSVWSCRTRGGLFVPWARMTPYADGTGRLNVGLRAEGKLHRRLVSRLVLEAFVGPCPPGMECCHEDGDYLNNRLTNLRWDTHVNNVADAIRHGRTQRGLKNWSAKLTVEQVHEIRQRCSAGEQQKFVARDYRINASCVQKIVSRESWAWLV